MCVHHCINFYSLFHVYSTLIFVSIEFSCVIKYALDEDTGAFDGDRLLAAQTHALDEDTGAFDGDRSLAAQTHALDEDTGAFDGDRSLAAQTHALDEDTGAFDASPQHYATVETEASDQAIILFNSLI